MFIHNVKLTSQACACQVVEHFELYQLYLYPDSSFTLLRFTRQILYWPIQRCIGQIDPFGQCYSSLANELDVIQNHEMKIYYFTQMLLP